MKGIPAFHSFCFLLPYVCLFLLQTPPQSRLFSPLSDIYFWSKSLALVSFCNFFLLPRLPSLFHFPNKVALFSVHPCIKPLNSHYLDITTSHNVASHFFFSAFLMGGSAIQTAVHPSETIKPQKAKINCNL